MRKVIPQLAAHHRCIAPDLLGLGDTETADRADWSLRAQAQMVIGLLDELGLPRAHLVGHDHGGAVAQLLAADHPERLDRLVLSNAEAYDNWPSADERPFVTATQIPLLGAAVMWLYGRRLVFRLALIEAKAVKDATGSSELLDGLQRFDHPTLLLWGADDVHFGVEWAERLLRDIPGAVRLEVVADAGHLVMEEQPDRFAACVVAFLSEPISSPGIPA